MIMPMTRERSMLWDPFSEFQRLRSEMDRVLGPYEARGGAFPPVNLWSSDEEAVVQAEVPGVDPDALEISVQGNVLHLAGERKAEEPGEDRTALRRERTTGRFERQVRLPFEVEGDAVKAHTRHGVLTITLPRRADTRPRQIAVEAE